MKKEGLRIIMIPDCQVKPGVPLDHLEWCGKYIAEKQPDVIVCIGDFADMPSLSSYDKGTKSFEGRRYTKDIDSVHHGMDLLMNPIAQVGDYHPRQVITLGNHEDRIVRCIDQDAKLEGLVSLDDLSYTQWGWEVHEYREPVIISGVAFCHFFPSGVLGRPITTARMLLNKLHMSCVAGHQQGRDIAYGRRADGRDMTAIISGSFYQHKETYLGPYLNNHWKGIWMLNEVKGGSFDSTSISLNYLKRKFK
jgi:hypothetical protein